NDWHLHSPFEGPGEGYDPTNTPGIGAPDGGKAHHGVRSLHMGRHLDASTTLMDTARFRQVSAFVLDQYADPNVPGIIPGPATMVEFWQIVQFYNLECDGFCSNEATMGGQLQISPLGLDGKFERWTPLTPIFGSYDNVIQSSVSLCSFDPGDDSL